MSASSIVDNISALVEELGTEKTAMDDPGGQDGQSTHPIAKTDDPGEQAPSEGARSAENTKDIKKDIPQSVDATAEATPGNAPTQDEVQLGQGVDAAKPTGEDPSNESDYKGDKEDPPSAGNKDLGGTSHPAGGNVGEKYSADKLAAMDNETLFKTAADLGNELAADIANGHFNQPVAGTHVKQAMRTLTACPKCHKDYEGDSCDCGYTAKTAGDANSAAQAGENLAKLAAAQEQTATQVITNVVKHAHYRADLTAEYLRTHHAQLQKQAMEEDPMGGGAEGEDHGSEAVGGPGDGGEGAPGGGEEIAALLAGGGGPEGAPPEMGGEGMPPEGMGGPEGGPEGMPPELGGMGNEEALQQLAMALMELGIDPAELAGAGAGGPEMGGGPPMDMQGPKIASAVENYRKSGKFEVAEAKTAAQRKVRDYMKGVIREIHSRSNR